jgi:putative heme-binding domain-containing protein
MTLLDDILRPSRSIAQHYETYVIEHASGETAAGVLGAETPTTITLRQAGAREIVIRRAEIAKMTVSPQSTMPPDLDTLVSPEEMADLLAFIRR